MGCVKTIKLNKWPKQGKWLHLRAYVCFYYNTDEIITGTYVRDDAEAPWITIIKLDDDRYILTSECQHCPIG